MRRITHAVEAALFATGLILLSMAVLDLVSLVAVPIAYGPR